MNRSATPGSQRGAVMVVALIMLVLISVVVVSNFTMSTSNLRSIGNVQFRAEAIAAANRSLESLVSGSFLTALDTVSESGVDVDKNGVADYKVAVAIPKCPLRVARVSLSPPSGYETGGEAVSAGSYVVDWELTATVSDTATGAAAIIRHGLRLPMEESDYLSYVKPCGLTLVT